MGELPKHYRFHEVLDEEGVKIVCRSFVAIKETAQGYWVVPSAYESYPEWLQKEKKRFVLKHSERRYCYPEISKALHSLKIRKRRQVDHARTALETAEVAVAGVEKLMSDESLLKTVVAGNYFSCGGEDIASRFIWE